VLSVFLQLAISACAVAFEGRLHWPNGVQLNKVDERPAAKYRFWTGGRGEGCEKELVSADRGWVELLLLNDWVMRG